MSAVYGLMHENLPLAANVAGINPAILVGLGAAAAGFYNIKKMTPHWHHTIFEGEVGVWMKRGNPVLKPGVTREQVKADEAAGSESSESHYEIVGPGWYFVPPFKTLQTVYVTDQPGTLKYELDTSDASKQKLEVDAKISWNIIPDGDNPVRSIANVKHVKNDKKDSEASEKDKEVDALTERVISICSAGLGRVLSGRTAHDLQNLTNLGETEEDEELYENLREEVQQKTIKQSASRLLQYGVQLTTVEIMPIVRSYEEVQAQAIKTLSPSEAASLLNGSKKLETSGNGHGAHLPEAA